MKTKTDQHTPTPWFKEGDAFYSSNGSEIIDSKGYRIADHLKPKDADLIVKAVNSHEALLKVAKGAREILDHVKEQKNELSFVALSIFYDLDKVITQAEGGK